MIFIMFSAFCPGVIGSDLVHVLVMFLSSVDFCKMGESFLVNHSQWANSHNAEKTASMCFFMLILKMQLTKKVVHLFQCNLQPGSPVRKALFKTAIRILEKRPRFLFYCLYCYFEQTFTNMYILYLQLNSTFRTAILGTISSGIYACRTETLSQ